MTKTRKQRPEAGWTKYLSVREQHVLRHLFRVAPRWGYLILRDLAEKYPLPPVEARRSA